MIFTKELQSAVSPFPFFSWRVHEQKLSLNNIQKVLEARAILLSTSKILCQSTMPLLKFLPRFVNSPFHLETSFGYTLSLQEEYIFGEHANSLETLRFPVPMFTLQIINVTQRRSTNGTHFRKIAQSVRRTEHPQRVCNSADGNVIHSSVFAMAPTSIPRFTSLCYASTPRNRLRPCTHSKLRNVLQHITLPMHQLHLEENHW